jgi:Zn-dependent peptidase ImmA (M78 family)
VNENHHVHRQRFNIAHELGHYFLNHEGGQFIDDVGFDGEYGTGIMEKVKELKIADQEANEFASELLIPLKFIKADFKNENNPEILARRYNVSEAALFVSLLKHRLIK